MKVYVSGPITGYPDLNRAAFAEGAARVAAAGHEPVNPHDIVPNSDTASWEACLRADLRALTHCDAITLLPGWEKSRGALLELHVAQALNMLVIKLP